MVEDFLVKVLCFKEKAVKQKGKKDENRFSFFAAIPLLSCRDILL